MKETEEDLARKYSAYGYRLTPELIRRIKEEIWPVSMPCSTPGCRLPSTTLHFDSLSLKGGCHRHDPGGYWIRVSDFNSEPEMWIAQLSIHDSDRYLMKLRYSRDIKKVLTPEEAQSYEAWARLIPLKVRFKIFQRDDFKCVYCGSTEDLEIDHVLPYSKVRDSSEENLVTACKRCNRGKRNYVLLTDEEREDL